MVSNLEHIRPGRIDVSNEFENHMYGIKKNTESTFNVADNSENSKMIA
jgi:hypothetical protein